jgi:hypothetical protein
VLPTQQGVAATGTGYMSVISNAPIVLAFANISASIPSGSCPSTTITVFGKAVPFESFCTLWASVAGYVTTVMLIAWVLMGAKILMSA